MYAAGNVDQDQGSTTPMNQMHSSPEAAATCVYLGTGKDEVVVFRVKLDAAVAMQVLSLGPLDPCSLHKMIKSNTATVTSRASFTLRLRDIGHEFKSINICAQDHRKQQLQLLAQMMRQRRKVQPLVVGKAYFPVARDKVSPQLFESQVVKAQQLINCYLTPADARLATIAAAAFRNQKEWDFHFRGQMNDDCLAGVFRSHKTLFDPAPFDVASTDFHLAVVDITVDMLHMAVSEDCP